MQNSLAPNEVKPEIRWASSCCAAVHRGNTWLFTEADRLSASRSPVAKEDGLRGLELKPLETDHASPQLAAV